MSRSIVKQPDGKYAVWSTVIDDFISENATPQQIIEMYLDDYRQEVTADIMNRVRLLNKGQYPLGTMSYEDAMKIKREVKDDFEY